MGYPFLQSLYFLEQLGDQAPGKGFVGSNIGAQFLFDSRSKALRASLCIVFGGPPLTLDCVARPTRSGLGQFSGRTQAGPGSQCEGEKVTAPGSDVLASAVVPRPDEATRAAGPEGVFERESSRLARARRIVERPRVNKVLRYAVTSGVATGVSEITLLALYASGFLGASGASIVANLAGTVPSYLLSRYWIWPEAERSGAARQMGLYWVTSAVSLVASTAATSLAAAHSPAGHGTHVIIVGAAYIAAYAVLWVAKFLVYQRVIFRTPPAEAGAERG